GKQNNWNIQGYTKSGCTPVPLSSASPDADQAGQDVSDACEEFIEESSEEFQTNDDIDVAITAASPTDKDFYDESGNTSDKLAMNELTDMWQDWNDAGKDVVVIGEAPHFGELNGPTCAESNPDDIREACSAPAAELINGKGRILTSATQNTSPAIKFYNPVPGICDDERCYSMVGSLITR